MTLCRMHPQWTHQNNKHILIGWKVWSQAKTSSKKAVMPPDSPRHLLTDLQGLFRLSPHAQGTSRPWLHWTKNKYAQSHRYPIRAGWKSCKKPGATAARIHHLFLPPQRAAGKQVRYIVLAWKGGGGRSEDDEGGTVWYYYCMAH